MGVLLSNHLARIMFAPMNIFELATEAAKEGVVLLKNINETLPLDSAKFKNIAVIGPHANSTAATVGNYAGFN